MIGYFYRSDIEAETYLPLYKKLKEAIGISEENDSNCKVSGIYYIYNQDNTLLYIGQSKNIASRLTTHIRGKYRNSHKIIIDPVYEEELNDVERFMIDKLKPIDNVMVSEEYDIERTEWSEQFLRINDNGEELFDFSNVETWNTDNPRTKIYPAQKVILYVDFVPELYRLLEIANEVSRKDLMTIVRLLGVNK